MLIRTCNIEFCLFYTHSEFLLSRKSGLQKKYQAAMLSIDSILHRLRLHGSGSKVPLFKVNFFFVGDFITFCQVFEIFRFTI